MADKKISQLTDGGAPQATDEFVVDRAGTDNFKLDFASIKAAAEADAVLDGDPAGGVLSGTYPDPGFAVDMATQAELDSEATTRAADDATIAGDLATHIADPTGAHAGTAISNAPAGSIAATTVQGAINELDSEKPATGDVVLKSLYDANTVLAANSDDTPAALTMGASTILARLAAGNIKAASVAEIVTLLQAYTVGGTDVALADGGTGASLADPNADRIMFWDDSAGAVTWLSPGTNLSITGTTLDAAGGGGSATTTAVAQVAHGFAVGDVVKLSGSNTYAKAQANSAANAEVVGIVSAVADANNFTLTTGGEISGLSGLTANTVYYLSASSAGALTATEPTTVGQVSKPILNAKTTTTGYVFNMRGATVTAAATSSVTRSARSSDTVLAGTDRGNLIAATAAYTQTITAAATLGSGWWCYIKNDTQDGTTVLVVNPNGTETIDGLTTITMYSGETRLLLCDGSNFTSQLVEGGFLKCVPGGIGTFVVPAGLTSCDVLCIGPGGQGGGGASAVSTAKSGGGGGGGGAVTRAMIRAADLGAAGTGITVTAAAGGTGGGQGGSAGAGANGSNGTDGTNSSFGSLLKAGGGGGGQGGQSGATSLAGAGGSAINSAVANTAGAPSSSTGNSGQGTTVSGSGAAGGSSEFGGASGGGGRSANSGQSAGSSIYGGPAGGAGGGVSGTNVGSNGGAAGTNQSQTVSVAGAGGTGGASPTSGTTGAGTTPTPFCGRGGDGGGGGTAVQGANGRPGGIGAGGGGGGSSSSASSSAAGGAGGAGGDGEVRVWYS